MNLFNHRGLSIIAVVACVALSNSLGRTTRASILRAPVASRYLDEDKSNDKKNDAKDDKKDADADADKTKVEVDKLPKVVVTSVKKEMPGAKITKASKIEKDGKVTYYLDNVKVGKKAWDVTVADDGKILKKEECHDDD